MRFFNPVTLWTTHTCIQSYHAITNQFSDFFNCNNVWHLGYKYMQCVCVECVYVCQVCLSVYIEFNGQRVHHYETSKWAGGFHESLLDRATLTALQRGVARECHLEGVCLTICVRVCACVCVCVCVCVCGKGHNLSTHPSTREILHSSLLILAVLHQRDCRVGIWKWPLMTSQNFNPSPTQLTKWGMQWQYHGTTHKLVKCFV